MEIKIYAPVDCEILSIDKCSDSTFSQKLLGDGFLVKPKMGNFSLPFDEANVVMVFDTKHAYGFDIEGLGILIHCGLETVNLNGEPFKTLLEPNQKIIKGKKIFDVDLKLLKDKKISSETPIVFDKKITINNFKEGNYKKGDLVCTVTFVKEKAELKNEIPKLNSFESKYLVAAKQFIQNVGGFENFSDVYNCMTRLRFKINDKSKVSIKEISQNELVKGTVWNGSELQVIIGGECYKVKDEIINLKNNPNYEVTSEKKEVFIKPKMSKRFLAAVTGIMTPQIPTLMAVALLAATQALLVSLNIIPDASQMPNAADAGLFPATIYILSKVGFSLMGVLFCISTAKYFKGNVIMAALIGLTITSRMLFSGEVIDIETAKFGDWTQSDVAGPGWLLFKIGSFPILVKGYEGSVLPFIAAAILMVYLDNWIKSWINPTVDIIFRPFLVYTAVSVATLFIFGPALGMVEFGLSQICILFEKIPLGLGIALFAMLWQVMVLSGVHVAVIMSIMIGTLFQSPVVPTSLDIATAIGSFGQVGAAIGLIFVTRNSQLKNYTTGCLAAGFLGISEPIIYGATLPKIRPFIGGCIGAGIGGWLLGLLNIKASVVSGLGVFSITAVSGFADQALFILCWVVTIATGALFTILLYSEKWDEYKYSKKQFRKINKILLPIFKNKNEDLNLIKEKLNKIENVYLEEVQKNKSLFNKYYKYFILKTKYESKTNLLIQKEEKIKRKLYNNAERMLSKEKVDKVKLNKAIIKSNDFNLDKEKNEINKKLIELKNLNSEMISEYNEMIKNLTISSEKALNDLAKLSRFEEITKFKTNMHNAINSVEINFGVIDEQEQLFNKQDRLKAKTFN
ncbi:hypothetical protein CK556_00220 [Mesoplasma chauliocola]|uniref:PTS beta-glucoside transporter subunit EIIBCA n=1 Tax=Mesoplasma chauliocola TaxID=216427 RepID=A0A249SMG1_9MOLU|nr:PTS glucose transporter subunit IIABC [Mesoplasma chauliocola]ASZ08792.1 hypothetical protein CK556_00220 [Mesoplasma chauliocola]